MLAKKFLTRKEFCLTDIQYGYIDAYFFEGKDFDETLPEFSYEYGGFILYIQMIPAENNVMELKCILCDNKDNRPIYITTYGVGDFNDLSNIFMIDTKNKFDNELVNHTKDEVIFLFTFSYSKVEKIDVFYNINLHLPSMDKPLSNIIALMKYNSLEEQGLYRILIEFLYTIQYLEYLSEGNMDLTYTLNQLDYLKKKLDYAGYDEEYLVENYEKAEKITKAKTKDYNLFNNEEIMNYLITTTLDYLYKNKTYLKLEHRDLAKLSKSYCDNLIKDIESI